MEYRQGNQPMIFQSSEDMAHAPAFCTQQPDPLRIFSKDAGVPVTDVVIGQIAINDRPVQCMDELELVFAHCENVTIML